MLLVKVMYSPEMPASCSKKAPVCTLALQLCWAQKSVIEPKTHQSHRCCRFPFPMYNILHGLQNK